MEKILSCGVVWVIILNDMLIISIVVSGVKVSIKVVVNI